MTDKKDKNRPKEGKTKSHGKNKYIALGIIAVMISTVAYVIYSMDNTVDTSFSSIDGIPCETQEYSTFHIHAHMDIFVNGQRVGIPSQIGIEKTCLYWIHTHTSDGILHIESPKDRDFTVEQFTDIWNSTSKLPPMHNSNPIIFVNGNLISTKLNNTVINAHDEIVLVYGKVPQNIPTFYQFPDGE